MRQLSSFRTSSCLSESIVQSELGRDGEWGTKDQGDAAGAGQEGKGQICSKRTRFLIDNNIASEIGLDGAVFRVFMLAR